MSKSNEKREPLFLDANIFIDILQKRSGWQNSLAIITAINTKKLKGCVSALSVAIIHYVWKRQASERQARQDIKSIIESFDILAITSDHVYSSLDEDSLFTDFEDALQFHSARGTAGAIITRNKRHYSKVANEIQVLTPEELLKKYDV
jgi:predicted nucleic acid-binding protein